MGVCCVKQHNQDKEEFRSGTKTECSLFKGNKEAIEKTIKIQSAYRRYKAIKQLTALKKETPIIEKSAPRRVMKDLVYNSAEAEPAHLQYDDPNAEIKENSKVKELELKLGPFKPEKRIEDNVDREHRGTVILDNGAHYNGEW